MLNIKTKALISEDRIQKKVRELALEIDKKFEGQKVIAIGILKGSFTFYADLLRHLSCAVLCDFCSANSYGKNHTPSEEVRLTLDTDLDIKGQNILLVEDIVDRGLTLAFLQNHFKNRKPLSMSTVALVVKPQSVRKMECQVDYTGFTVERSSFLVGYGMDYQEQFRHLPYIAEISNLN